MEQQHKRSAFSGKIGFVLLAGSSRAGQGDQDLVGVQAGVLAAQIVGLEGLDGLDGGGRNEVKLLVDTGQLFQRVEQSGGSGTQQGAGLAGDNGTVRQLDGGSGSTAGLLRDSVRLLLYRLQGPVRPQERRTDPERGLQAGTADESGRTDPGQPPATGNRPGNKNDPLRRADAAA